MAPFYVFSSEEGERYVPKRIVDEGFTAMGLNLADYRTGKNTHMTKSQCEKLARDLEERSHNIRWSKFPNLDPASNEQMVWTARKARPGEEGDLLVSGDARSILHEFEGFLRGVQCCVLLSPKD